MKNNFDYTNTTAFSKFYQRIREFENKRILLMLSGGIDSMILLTFLYGVKVELNLEIACFHLNHSYRGKDADDDENFVKNYATKLGITVFSHKENIPEISKTNKESFEECGRRIRHSLAQRIAKENAFDYIATAHHLDDSIESVLHSIIRGSGINGLKGIDFTSNNLIRPLIDSTKDELSQIASLIELDYRQDKTNENTEFTRNSIRKNIIPLFLEINPKFKSNFSTFNSLIRNDICFLDSTSRSELEKISNTKLENFKLGDVIEINLAEFNSLSKSIRSRIIRIIIELIQGNLVNVYSGAIEEILNLSENTNTGKHIIYKDIRFEISRDKFIINKNSNLTEALNIENIFAKLMDETRGDVRFSFMNKNFSAELMDIQTTVEFINKDSTSNQRSSNNSNYIIFPESKFINNLVFRTREPGDFIRPKRLNGSKRLIKKLFIDLKLNGIQKESQVLLCHESEVIWIPGIEKKDIQINPKTSFKENENFFLLRLLNL